MNAAFMKAVFVLVSVLLAALVVVGALEPKGDVLYGIYSFVGAQNTENIVETGLIDPTNGTVTPIVTNFVYVLELGGSLNGFSTFDQANGIFYYETGVASTFLWGVDVVRRQLAPPIDFGATLFASIDYNPNDGNIYAAIEVENEQQIFEQLYISYSTGNGPATIVANLTDYLSSTRSMLAAGAAINTVNTPGTPSDYFFLSFNGPLPTINIYNATTNEFNGTVITGPCTLGFNKFEKWFERLWYNSTNGMLWGIQQTMSNGEFKAFHTQVNPVTGGCTNSSPLEMPDGQIVAFTYSPYSNTLYFLNTIPNHNQDKHYLCSAPVADDGVGAVTCTPTTQALTDIEVAYPTN